MKHTVLLACIGLLILFTGCGGKETETAKVGGEVRVVAVERVVTAQTVVADDGRSVLLVPSSALFMRGQLEGVQVVGDDGVVSVRWIRTGNVSGDDVEVLSGLGNGEKVVAPYVREVREGFQVTVKQ